jgi:cytochrome c-type biogenesis protein CcmH
MSRRPATQTLCRDALQARRPGPSSPALTWLIALLCTLAAAAVPAAAGAAAAKPRPSLPVIERQVMCVTCKIPLNVAQSTQANDERAFIQELIDQGKDEAEIKNALVGQYGPAVLGLPSDHGFDATAYLVPLAVLLGLLLTIAVVLPRWRASTRAGRPSADPPPALAPSDAARLESDLARFD